MIYSCGNHVFVRLTVLHFCMYAFSITLSTVALLFWIILEFLSVYVNCVHSGAAGRRLGVTD